MNDQGYCCCSSFFFCFHALMQCTHWPPFLKCGQIIYGYLLDLEILLSFKNEDYDF